MFGGGAKPTFGAGSGTTGFGGFGNAATTTAFGQSAFGKPATSAFGAAPSFGAQQTAPSLFGQAAQQAQPTGLFGGASTAGAFGGTTTATPSFGGFSQPQQSTSIFGAAAQTAPNASLFGQTGTSTFGAAVKPTGLTGFGQQQTPQQTPSMFGQQTASTSAAAFGGFGQAAPTTTNVFGSGAASAFGQPQAASVAGSTNAGSSIVKYQPTVGTDTLMKSGQPSSINTKQHCITAMKEYEIKSLEELRMEDYLAGRKGPQAGTTAGGFFGAGGVTSQPAVTGTGLFGSTAQTAPSLFGQTGAPGTENKGLFGQNAFGQPAVSSAFGATPQQNNFMAKPFCAPTTTGFGATNTDASNLFGAKPGFGQTATTGLFGQQQPVSAAPAFGQTTTSGFGGFGATANTQQTSLFGATNPADANKPAFGLGSGVSGANTGFGGFGTTATSTAGGGGLFGSKPATGFGATPGFGVTSTANTGFGNFTMNNPATTGTGLFNSALNKPATTGFGAFNAQPTAPLNFNAGNAGGSLFSNTIAKPGGLFGGAGTLGTAANPVGGGGLFGGGTSTFGTTSTLGTGFGTIGGNTSLAGGLGGTMQQQQVIVPIHQQILAKVTSPYGDTPIFKDLKRNDEADATRATNPAAQQAILNMTNNQFKADIKSSPSVLRVKPVGNTLDRKSLFDGLEQYDSSVETFILKPSAKRLIMNPKANNTTPTSSKSVSSNINNSVNSNTNGSVNSNINISGSSNIAVGNTVRVPAEQVPPLSNNEFSNGDIHKEAGTGTVGSGTIARLDSDISRRESWLHPNNLEKVRQHNIQSGLDNAPNLNSTVTELVPRKPLETYRHSTSGNGGRLSMSTVPENPFEEQVSTISRREAVNFSSEQTSENLLSRSYGGGGTGREELLGIEVAATTECEPHPTGITLRRVGYYTIPSLDDLKSYLAEDGSCVVPNFTIGREGYGNVYFGKEMDVSGLNLDEIVHFRNKEIIVYPDDDLKPSFNQGLNREAQVTLDQVWPHDKSKHEPIKDPQRLAEMDWEAKLRRVCDKNDTRFIEYRPETGSWVFRVKHFSKYGLSESDEDELLPADPKKAKLTDQAGVDGRPNQAAPALGTTATVAGQMTLNSLKQAQKISEEAARALDPRTIAAGVAGGFYPMDDSVEFMLMDKTQYFQTNGNNYSMFDAPKIITSPTAALAKQLARNDAHKVQLMKASLFGDDENVNNIKSVGPSLGLYRERADTAAQMQWKEGISSENSSQFDFGQTSPPLPASSSASIMSVVREVQSETSSPALDSDSTFNGDRQQSTRSPMAISFTVRPEVASIKSFASIVPLHKSIAYPLCTTWLADFGIYKRFTFKSSFGAQNTLTMLTTNKNCCKVVKFDKLVDAVPQLFKARANDDCSGILVQRIKISATQAYDNFKDSIEPHLEIELRNALQHEVEGSECPWFQADCGTDLIVKHLEEAIKLADNSDADEYPVSVWSLLLALWGEHEQLDGQDASCHYSVMFRRNLLSEWLENTLVERELLSKQVSRHSYLEHMLELLMCHRVIEACELAISYDDVNLALILAQLSGGPVVRQLVEVQLASWHMTKADKHIAVERLKMYMLAAGVPLMRSSHGALNVLEKINWIKALALQLWYFKSPTCSITDALLAYEKSFTSQEFYSLPPTPSYEEAHYNGNRVIYDLRYHLLQLYSKRSHPLESLLNPATNTNDPMDYRLSWLLLQTLEALGYHQCSPLSECQLHVNFANQLENNGLWEWGVFVLLHIKHRHQREIAVQQMLYRYVSLSNDVALSKQERFITHRLGVPEKWIDYAKAVKAGASRQYHLQAKYLLKAKQWSLAHEIIYQHIAPDCIINDNLRYLQNLLSQFECTEQRTNVCVPNWSNQGQIFLEYMDISEKFHHIKSIASSADIEARWENLKPQLAELCSRINLLPCPTVKHRLCQSEIAQSLACLVRGMLFVDPSLESCMILKISLDRLPLPQEYANKELYALLESVSETISKATLVNNERPQSTLVAT